MFIDCNMKIAKYWIRKSITLFFKLVQIIIFILRIIIVYNVTEAYMKTSAVLFFKK